MPEVLRERNHPEPPVLAEVVRSGFVESRHRGRLIALHADGSVAFSVGDVTSPIFPRSANKPMQAAGMLRAGLDVKGDLLALVAGSHSGEPFHLDGVRRLLGQVGLDESALRCPPAWPIDDQERSRMIRAGDAQSRIAMNCSGKHAGMLATCVVAGWPTASYVDPAHPLQVRIRETITKLCGEDVAYTGVDGCGAPLFALSLSGLARAFRALALAAEGSAEHRVAEAARSSAVWMSGTRRDEAVLVQGVPGLFAKGGAEACYAVALPDGRAVALKIEDGGGRARPVVMASALRRLGVVAEIVERQLSAPVLGGGIPVGEIRPAGW